ncbi:uncharacterized protein SAPINGB_P003606 [Magnusiomyces paraingens]|uniref:Hyphally-regulated cell wall protein N-terminal domain-containing protein n=1 Tax=Magnusiomyces paraingens TaxID=2606893 RepID=A0A5E8BQ68_9ASCO|nr:uncharacterized protein SAPINGB_P003606 [Saprochaete ingens]VVT53503.1 unnamed protein product [Saprochaete ingens]
MKFSKTAIFLFATYSFAAPVTEANSGNGGYDSKSKCSTCVKVIPGVISGMIGGGTGGTIGTGATGGAITGTTTGGTTSGGTTSGGTASGGTTLGQNTVNNVSNITNKVSNTNTSNNSANNTNNNTNGNTNKNANNNNNDNKNNNSNENQNNNTNQNANYQVNFSANFNVVTIYILPNGILSLTPANGSVPFSYIINGNSLITASPGFSSGTVVVNSDGSLQIVQSGSSFNNWISEGGYITPGGRTIYACPDSTGAYTLYCDNVCPGGKIVAFTSDGTCGLQK